MAVHLVCEGFRQGLDERMLDAVVIQYHNLAVLTSPSGGSRGLGAVRAYLQSRSAHDVAVAVEDRNHRPFAVANATWANQASRSFIWRRHEIENYLLHPRVVLALFDELRACPACIGQLDYPRPSRMSMRCSKPSPPRSWRITPPKSFEMRSSGRSMPSGAWVSALLGQPLRPVPTPRDSPSGWQRSFRRRPGSPRHVRRLPAYRLSRPLQLRRGIRIGGAVPAAGIPDFPGLPP